MLGRLYGLKLGEALRQPIVVENRQRFAVAGLEITLMSVREFNEFTLTELAKWTKLVKDSSAKVD